MESLQDLWYVVLNGEVYQADPVTLARWIRENRIGPTDLVSGDGTNWAAVASVAAFAPAFKGPESGGVPGGADLATTEPVPTVLARLLLRDPLGCDYHPTSEPKFVCLTCDVVLCGGCVRRFQTAGICLRCGNLCRISKQFVDEIRRGAHIAESKGRLGLSDFRRALGYPLADRGAFFVASGIYGILGAFSLPGKLVAVPLLVAYMTTAIGRVARGREEDGFLPDQDEPVYDMFVRPLALGAAIAAVTWAPLAEVLWHGGWPLPATVTAYTTLAIALLWAAFYYPAALLVAGFTRSVLAVVNPLVGLDTIHRLGADYIRAQGMCVVVFALQGGAFFGLNAGMWGAWGGTNPFLVELVLIVVQGVVGFHAGLVVAYILGRAIFKNSGRLGIAVR